MKKTYINPAMNVITLRTQQQMLAGSVEVGGSTNQALGREADFDDEE